ncbi:hypothetical protein LTR66_008823 [Elasticomyces elasticus]|nr:hypothetical protein LTR66_008823 [Elasticomyces elasticus]
MALKFGLNVAKKPSSVFERLPSGKRNPIFGEDPESDSENNQNNDGVEAEEISVFEGTSIASKPVLSSKSSSATKPTTRTGGPPKQAPKRDKPQLSQYGDLSANRVAQRTAQQAEELDPTIYDYDTFHTAQSSIRAAKKEAERQDAIARKPKYIHNLLDAANKRKQDQLVAKEKLLQREREAEGDEFADKERFVTEAYKAQQEETRKAQEEEERKKAEEDKKRGSGMQGFYKSVMERDEKRHREAVEAAERLVKNGGIKVDDGPGEKTELQLAAELKAQGKDVYINEDGQVADKRQLLSAGLNIAPRAPVSKNESEAERARMSTQRHSVAKTNQQGPSDAKRAMRERQTRMMEEQLAEAQKRAAEDEAEELAKRERAAKSRKTETEIGSTKERYLARKAAAAAKPGS